MHRFAAQKFADAGAQHGAAITPARVRRAPSPFKLQLQPTRSFAQQQRAAIAQLSGPHAKLVAAIDRGQRLRARELPVAAEGIEQLIGRHPGRVQTQCACHSRAAPDPVGCGQRLGRQRGQEIGAELGEAVVPVQANIKMGINNGLRIHASIVGHLFA